MFKLDSPVMTFLGKVADLVILNILVMVCSLPIVTIGAAWTALYYVTVKMVKNEESYVVKDFFKSFKQNFKQATLIWLGNLIIIVILVLDAIIMIRGAVPELPQALTAMMIVADVFVICVMIYTYPVLSRFYNTSGKTIRNALLLAISNFPYTLLFIVVIVAPYLITFYTQIGFRLMPIFILIGISGPAYLCSFGWKRIFAKLEPKPEEDSADVTDPEELPELSVFSETDTDTAE